MESDPFVIIEAQQGQNFWLWKTAQFCIPTQNECTDNVKELLQFQPAESLPQSAQTFNFPDFCSLKIYLHPSRPQLYC